MRRTILLTNIGLALSLAAAAAVTAQPPRRDAGDRAAGDSTVHGRRGPGGPGERGGPDRMLLRGITLTDAQQQRIAAIRTEQRQQMEASREQSRAAMEQARAARARGDTVAANAAFQQLRSRMEQARDREAAAIRNVLTAEQRKQFDANRTELAQRMKERGQDGERRGDRGPRGDGRPGGTVR